jgi:hypothetical protein
MKGIMEYNDAAWRSAVKRIWGIIRMKEKIASDAVASLQEAGLDEALDELCRMLDVPRPIVLKKHRSEFLRFGRTRFSPGDFIETVRFTGFEVELLRDGKKKDAASTASIPCD